MSTSHSTRTREDIKARLAARVRGNARNVPDPIPEDEPMLVAAQDAPEGKIRLSSLVPTWDHTRGTSDPWITPPCSDDTYAIHVPAPMPWYRPNQETLSELAYALEYNGGVPTMITGDPSVGKSSIVQYYCSIMRRPFFRFNYSEGLDSTALLGTQRVVATPTGPETQWHDGFVTEAIQIPGAIILHDEMTAAGSVLMAYQRLFEKNGVLILNEKPGSAEDKVIVPAANVSHVIADNTRGLGDSTGKFLGTQVLNTATLDRIGTFITMDFLPREDESAMLHALYPSVNPKIVQGLVRVAEACRTAYRQGNLPVPMSSRVMQSCLQHLTHCGNLDKALRLAFLNRFDSDSDVQAVLKIKSDIMGV